MNIGFLGLGKFDFADWTNINEEKIKRIFHKNILNKYNLPKKGLNSPQLIIETKINV